MSPCTSSNLPESNAGHASYLKGNWTPIWSCSEWGLPCHRLLPAVRCALTTPFHPYLWPFSKKRTTHRRSTLCCTFRRLTPPRNYLALCPMEPGLSSPANPTKPRYLERHLEKHREKQRRLPSQLPLEDYHKTPKSLSNKENIVATLHVFDGFLT